MYNYGWGEDPYALPGGPALTDAVRTFATGMMSGEEFQQIFLNSTVYCQRGDRPGFLTLSDAPHPIIPMFSSLEELKEYAGGEPRHFSGTGLEMLDLLPNGHAIVLDMAGEHRVVLDAMAIEELLLYSARRY
ncbi:MAG: SseB family protein [Carbonactinosporaceae bacterium]